MDISKLCWKLPGAFTEDLNTAVHLPHLPACQFILQISREANIKSQLSRLVSWLVMLTKGKNCLNHVFPQSSDS